jgi:DNA-binding NarL/FixJ family response regulator
VLLKQRSEDKNELQGNVLSNVKELVGPYLDQLKKSRLSTRQQTLLRILESNLNNIVSPFLNRLSTRFLNLTPTEIRVINLIKEGKTNKEIAELLLISKNTVLFHRHNIRGKLNLKIPKLICEPICSAMKNSGFLPLFYHYFINLTFSID